MNDRIISIQSNKHPMNINVMQIYALTTIDAMIEGIEKFHCKLQDVPNVTSRKDIVLLINDQNAKVGESGLLSVGT